MEQAITPVHPSVRPSVRPPPPRKASKKYFTNKDFGPNRETFLNLERFPCLQSDYFVCAGLSRRPGPCVRPSVGPAVRPSVRPSVRQSVRPSVCPSVRPSVRPSVVLSLIEVLSLTSIRYPFSSRASPTNIANAEKLFT